MINIENLELQQYLPMLSNNIDLCYGDCIYEDFDLSWVDLVYSLLKKDGIFIVQTDYHTVANYKLKLDSLFGKDNFLNWCIYKQEWGGASKRFFPKKHDDILIYCKGKDYIFDYENIRVPKVTAGTALDVRGDGLKIPCDVFDDLGNFSTISKERVKNENGKCIQWQKPMKLMDRLLRPFTRDNYNILDPFSGSGTTALWCKENNRNFYGCEKDKKVYEISLERLDIVTKI